MGHKLRYKRIAGQDNNTTTVMSHQTQEIPEGGDKSGSGIAFKFLCEHSFYIDFLIKYHWVLEGAVRKCTHP